MRNFRKLHVWSDSILLADVIYKTTSNFPDSEKWDLTCQMVRSAVSIPSNIAEGCGRKSNKDFSRYVQIVLGSAFELETQLIISRNREHLGEADFELILENIQFIQ